MQTSGNIQQQEDAALAFTLLKSSIESLKDILIFSIDKNYCYLHFNSAFAEATRFAYGTEVEKGVSMLDTITDVKEKQKAKNNSDRALAGESHTTVEGYGTLNPSYFETRYSPIKNDNDEIIGVTILSTNITERKLAEEQIRALNNELEAFSYSVAHDLRAPLRIINGYSGVLIEDHLQSLNEECQGILKIISGNVKKMGQLIEDLLNFSKLGRTPLNKRPIDTHALVQSIISEQLAGMDSSRVEIRLDKLENLNGDGNLMKHVFTNLISNAFKYSNKKEKSEVEIRSWRESEIVTYSIKDNGVGFDIQYADKMFGVFQRLHKESEFEGTGVGLAIVHRIVSRHGGKVWAEGEVNKGATFYVSLPL
jgi:signal transduction histidine kinase